MKNNGHLFSAFIDQVVTDDDSDPVKKEIEKVANQNGLTVAFNKLGVTGGATVVPPENQVTVTLAQGGDNKWRVLRAR